MFLQIFYFVTSVTYMDRVRISSWHSRTTEKITPQTNSVFLPPNLFSQSISLIMETDKQNWVFVRFYFLIRLFLVPGCVHCHNSSFPTYTIEFYNSKCSALVIRRFLFWGISAAWRRNKKTISENLWEWCVTFVTFVTQ